MNTFPFNAVPAQHHAHPQSHAHFDDGRLARQGPAPVAAAAPVIDLGVVAAAGERCVDKVTMVEETEYDEVIECHHSYNERCHITYKVMEWLGQTIVIKVVQLFACGICICCTCQRS